MCNQYEIAWECWNNGEENSDEVFKEALLNTYFMSPPRIYRWDQMLFNPEYEGEEFMSPSTEEAINQDLIGNCLTNSKENKRCGSYILSRCG